MPVLASFTEALAQPEYLHVLLNPLPIYGLLMGILGLLVSLVFFRTSAPARIIALLIIGISAASIWPVIHYGEAGYDRVLAMSNSEGGVWLNAHAERADRVAPLYYALAGVSLAALLIPLKWPRAAIPLTVASLILALGSAAGGAWVGYAGGKVRHTEFRNGPPPH